MISFLASLLPIAIYLVVLRLMDSFSLISWKRFAICFVFGTVVAALLAGASFFVDFPTISGMSVMPLLEELLKGSLIIWLVRRKKLRFLAETLIYGASIGGGFALLENIVYLQFNPQMSITTCIFRGLDCAFMHMGCTALTATLLLLLVEKKAIVSIPVAYIPSILLHFLHNNIDVPYTVKMAATIFLFVALFILLFNLGESKIYKWMDHSISVDVQTLSSIKSGNFASTKAGEFLLGVKEQFPPVVFFDMINYVELYLELKIEKQSRMLLSQAGFEVDNSETSEFVQKQKEYTALRGIIGKTGCMILAPLTKDEI
ncbi:MAG: PrsW family intramembrane metalloprotease [Bacteroidales bacterium]|nr:PrsW family intramembrane metalloprotease [Candidatus Cacconaster merdequi]